MNKKWNNYALFFAAALSVVSLGQTPIAPSPVAETVAENYFRSVKASWPVVGEYRMASSPLQLASGWRYQVPTTVDPSGWVNHEVRGTVDLTGSQGVVLRGDTNTVLYGTGSGVTVDFTGSRNCDVENLTIRADAGGIAMVFARAAEGASAGFHVVRNVHIEGQFVIEGSECLAFVDCTFTSKDSRPAIVIRNGAPKRWGYTMQQLSFRDCQFTNFNGGPAIRLTSTATMTDITFDGGGVSCGGASSTANDAAMVVDTGSVADHQLKQLHVSNMRWETTDRKNSIAIIGVNSIIGLAVRDSTFHQREAFIRGTRLDYSVIDNVDTFPGDPAYRDPVTGGPAIDVEPSGTVRVNLSNAVRYKTLLRP